MVTFALARRVFEETKIRKICLILQTTQNSLKPVDLVAILRTTHKGRKMFREQIRELGILVEKHAQHEGITTTPLPAVKCVKISGAGSRLPTVYAPCLCLIVQGKKDVMISGEVYHYSPAQFLMVSVDMPAIGVVTEAAKNTPYLCLQVDLDYRAIGALVEHIDLGRDGSNEVAKGLFVGQLDKELCDAILRLARLLDNPEDSEVLGELYTKEVYYRILKSKFGWCIANIAVQSSNMQKIAKIIQYITKNFDKPLSIEVLADIVTMGRSTFHQYFKDVTAITPLQFQKHLRLIEARRLMTAEAKDVAQAAFMVGYESPSQFSREYARLFGVSPSRDKV